jgi:hypothetical protein
MLAGALILNRNRAGQFGIIVTLCMFDVVIVWLLLAK